MKYFPVYGKRNKNINRSSYRRCSVKKGVLRNFANSQENTCARVSFLIKLQALVIKYKKISSVFPLCGIKRHWWNIFHFLEMETNIYVCIYVYIHIFLYVYTYIYIYICDSQIVHHNPCFNLFILHIYRYIWLFIVYII